MLACACQLVGPDTVLIQQTLPDLKIGGVFDAAVSTFDGLNYLTPAELHSTLTAVSRQLGLDSWLAFDLHTDAMLEFATSHPFIEGDANGMRFTISNVVDVSARTCDTRIERTGPAEADTVSEQHRQYFFQRCGSSQCSRHAGFGQLSVADEYTHRPATRSTLRASWISWRRAP